MPRVFDFVKSDASMRDFHYLDVGRVGNGEVSTEQIFQEDKIPTIDYGCGSGRRWQFGRTWSNPLDDAFEIDQIFESLSDNMKGQWHWNEGTANCDRSFSLAIHIEQKPDQERFLREWGHMFEYRPDEAQDLDKLAVVKGVLPPEEGILGWCGRHRGFDFRMDGETEYIVFEIPELEDIFIREKVDNGNFKPYYKGGYTGNKNDFFELILDGWLTKNEAFANDINSDRNTNKDDRVFLFAARYPIAEKLLLERWGDKLSVMLSPPEFDNQIVKAGEPFKGRIFTMRYMDWLNPNGNGAVPRKIPEDFMDYYEGKISFSAVNAPYKGKVWQSEYKTNFAQDDISGHLLSYD